MTNWVDDIVLYNKTLEYYLEAKIHFERELEEAEKVNDLAAYREAEQHLQKVRLRLLKDFEESWELIKVIEHEYLPDLQMLHAIIETKGEKRFELNWKRKEGQWRPVIPGILEDWYKKKLKALSKEVLESDEFKFVALINE
ncbi:hypothetical protein FZC84_21365 [Rossellomorea vietnamensis]|uniref:Uncharacterized protein n=1 Tax=Rossellomorea vietnamensis TaxID=218284 RepID=A0A5D4M1C6_9BACI|nr:hypothetical protein [Rossellomorea vietnamensis]TYR95744.1 hypothetical protein FZC84_21365 [Rossellomorea vietnamensis]